jgi:soluble lytic murein transglycosylase
MILPAHVSTEPTQKSNVVFSVQSKPASPPNLQMLVVEKADKYGIDKTVFFDLVYVESRFNPNMIGSCGEVGLCQIKPTTARWIANKMNVSYSYQDLFDPNYNTDMSAFFLRYLLNMYHGDYYEAVSSYNRGINSKCPNNEYVHKVLWGDYKSTTCF